MKQIFALVVAFTITTTAFSQAGQKWSTSGNVNSNGDFIGSTNDEPLKFKTNNIVRGKFTKDGDFLLKSLEGLGFRLLQTDSSGKLLPFPMSNDNEVLYGDGIWRPLPTPPPSTWELNGTSLFYLNGKVGIGTKTPFTNFDVIGDAYISNNLYVGGGIIITEKINANKEVLTAALRADSIVMDSTKAVYGYSVFKDQVKLENKLQVVGNTQIDGNFRVNGDFIFGGNKRIGYLPPSGGNPEVISFGGSPQLPLPNLPCLFPMINVITQNQFNGMIQVFNPSIPSLGGTTNILNMGFDGANGIIDMSGTNNQGGPGLLINYYCGKDVAINTGVNGGNVTMTNATMGMVGIGKIPAYKLDVAGNVSINNNSLFLKDENHGLSYYQDYADQPIDGPVLFGWSGGALAIKQGTTTKNVLTWKQDGSVSINTNNGVPEIKAFTISDEVSGVNVFRVMSSGHVYATEFTVKLKGAFPDYVFANNYTLMPLDDLDNFIKNNKHLPNIPNAKEVKENGLSIGEMQTKQMEKIEELTLYILELNKRLTSLEEENKNLKENK